MTWFVLFVLIVVVAALAIRVRRLSAELEEYTRHAERGLARVTERVWTLENRMPPPDVADLEPELSADDIHLTAHG